MIEIKTVNWENGALRVIEFDYNGRLHRLIFMGVEAHLQAFNSFDAGDNPPINLWETIKSLVEVMDVRSYDGNAEAVVLRFLKLSMLQ